MDIDPEYESALTDLVLAEHSRVNAERIAAVLAESPAALSTGLAMMLRAEQPIPQRISWSLFIAAQNDPASFGPHSQTIVDALENLAHPGEFRNMTNLLAIAPLPENKLGYLFDLCIQWIMNPGIHAATRANCMDIAFRIARNEPDLRNELALAIQEAAREGGPAIRARAKKISAKIAREDKKRKR